MLDINQLLNIGNESAGYENPKSLLDEMMEEIGFESDIDNAIYEADAAAVTSAASIVENVYAVMAEREAGIEGASVLEAYKGFGLEGSLVNFVGQEALSDVVKRRAYSGLTQIKSLINTLISWVSRILGLSTNTKKIFKSLAEKAKKIKKDLSTARSNFSAKNFKLGEDKEIVKEIANYLGEEKTDGVFGLKTVVKFYKDFKTIDSATDLIKFEKGKLVVNITQPDKNKDISHKEAYAEKIKNWKEDTKRETLGDNLFTEMNKGLDYLIANKNNNVDIDRACQKFKKHLERVRTEMENANTQDADLSKSHDKLNLWISYMNNAAMYMNMFAKFYVRIADELFTDVKWLIMKAN